VDWWLLLIRQGGHWAGGWWSPGWNDHSALPRVTWGGRVGIAGQVEVSGRLNAWKKDLDAGLNGQ
jgi:hypothetical protein